MNTSPPPRTRTLSRLWMKLVVSATCACLFFASFSEAALIALGVKKLCQGFQGGNK